MSQYRTIAPAFSSRQERMWRRNQNTVAFVPTLSLGPISHTVLIALMIAVLGLIYLTQVTKTSFYGYQLDAQDQRLSELRDTNQDLQAENARLSALERVKSSNVAASMTQPASTETAQN